MAIQLSRQIRKPFSSAARPAGASQLSGEFQVTEFLTATMLVDLTALGGTPTTTALDAKLQYSPDTSGNRWYDLTGGAITRLTAVGQQFVNNVSLGVARRVRVSYTLAFTGGTAPTATFEVDLALQQTGP